MKRQQDLQIINNLIKDSKKIFVQGHAKCGDAAGSTLAMAQYLEFLGKDFLAFSPAPLPEQLKFLPKSEIIVSDPDSFDLGEFDLLLILDCGDLDRTGIADKILSEKKATTKLVNIDHHYTNDGFGDLNFIDKSAPATATLVHEFFKVNNININKDIAACLMVGVFVDTGIFTNPATNQAALNQAADLLIAGVNINVILNSILKNRTLHGMKLWGRALERLTMNHEYKIAYTIILKKDLQDFPECTFEDVEGLSNFLNNLSDVRVSMVIREEDDNKIKFSLRTTQVEYDVGTLAAYFGGGGHRKAAGFTIAGRINYEEETGRWQIV